MDEPFVGLNIISSLPVGVPPTLKKTLTVVSPPMRSSLFESVISVSVRLEHCAVGFHRVSKSFKVIGPVPFELP